MFSAGIYLAGLLAIGVVLSRRTVDADGYFLAGRKMTWPVIGLSLFASNISSTTLVGLSGDAYATGISVYAYEWMAAVVLVIFAVFFLPLLLRSRVFTMPEFLAGRFDDRTRMYFLLLTLFLSIVVETAGSLFAGALVLKLVFPSLATWQTITILAAVAGFYTATGGLSAVMFTDALQAILLLIGSTVIAVVALERVGGWTNVVSNVPPEMLSLIRPLDDTGVPWLGLLTGVPLLGFYYWATNQAIVQRALSAQSVDHGRWGALLAGALKLLPLFIMVLPGSIAIQLYPNLERPDLVYPTLMFDLLPTGLLGLTLAGFLAAIMSQIDSALNSASTLVTMDFIHTRYPNLSSTRLVWVGRIVMVAFLVFAVIWTPLIANFRSIFSYLQTMFSYAVPPVVALFIVGVFWKRATAAGAWAGVLTGVTVGVAAFTGIEALKVAELHFLYVAPILSLVSAVAIIGVSLVTPAPDPDTISAYVWTKKTYDDESEDLRGRPPWRNYRYQAVLLLAATAVIVFIFR